MTRTTVDLDASVLRELRRRQRQEGKPLGRLISELLAAALAQTSADVQPVQPLEWATGHMRARVDLDDKEALQRGLDGR